MPKQQYNQSTFWQLRRLYGMLLLPQIQSIWASVSLQDKRYLPVLCAWLASQRPSTTGLPLQSHQISIGGRGVGPLLKTYQLSRNCFSVHDSQLFPGHDHSAADNSKPAMAVFKSRSIVWQLWRPAFQPWQSQRLDEPERCIHFVPNLQLRSTDKPSDYLPSYPFTRVLVKLCSTWTNSWEVYKHVLKPVAEGRRKQSQCLRCYRGWHPYDTWTKTNWTSTTDWNSPRRFQVLNLGVGISGLCTPKEWQ